MAVDMFLNLERVNGKSKDKTRSALPRYNPRKMAILSSLAMLSFSISTLGKDNDGQILPFVPITVSTVPANGDVNPYGVAFVPNGFLPGGLLNPGDILVSNFNNNQNLQGTGTTIVKISPNGQQSLFFKGNPPLGLTTALVALKRGFVVVGNLPTADGTAATARPGSLLFVDKSGNLVGTYSDPTLNLLNGPWDMTVKDDGDRAILFVSNVLIGTVTRLELVVGPASVAVIRATEIASGYSHRGDPAALEVGPAGLAYDAKRDVLFVASSLDNEVFAVPNAARLNESRGPGTVIYQDNVHLHGALAMVLAPNGHLLVSNNDVVNADANQPSEIVEFTTTDQFIGQLSVDPNLGGSFGLNLSPFEDDVLRFAAVDDNTSTITIWKLNTEETSHMDNE